MKNIRLRDLPSFIRTTDPDDVMINFAVNETDRASRATAIILNTFDALERDAIDSLSSFLPPILTIGPLQLMLNQVSDDDRFNSIDSNLWKEDRGCIEWLSSKQPNSVLYVNFGSVTVMTPHQLTEFAWGLANSKKDFLWIVRPDLIVGESAGLPPDFVVETKERGMLGSWCPQEEVLKHPAVAGFLTHSGWNSTMETVCGGVPVLCWPFFAEQPTNSWFSCTEWGIGLEIDSDVKREEVEKLVRELMEGEKGKDMKRKAVGWKKAAEEAVGTNGSSNVNLDKLIGEMLLPKNIPAV
ncbi:7-deoxyloganetin glucosyltransferase [Sarracenia purpurea var. burkii]